MKRGAVAAILIFLTCIAARAQLNVGLLHQLIADSKTEHGKQSDARDRQAESTVNEEANKTLMVKLKNKYREIQSRFKTLGLAVDAAQIGLEAYPLVNDIAISQDKIFDLCKDNPMLSILALEAEIDMGDKAYSLLNFLYGLALSMEDINQMKQSDRKMLFSHVLTELRMIAGASKGLWATLQYSSRKKVLNGLNPFSGFINTDKKLIDEILRKNDILKN